MECFKRKDLNNSRTKLKIQENSWCRKINSRKAIIQTHMQAIIQAFQAIKHSNNRKARRMHMVNFDAGFSEKHF
jgi:lipid A disaccharide synthetase